MKWFCNFQLKDSLGSVIAKLKSLFCISHLNRGELKASFGRGDLINWPIKLFAEHLQYRSRKRAQLTPRKQHQKTFSKFTWIHDHDLGFYNRKGFIISQHPLESTVSALWQLVAEQDVQVTISQHLYLYLYLYLYFQVIVVLSNLDNQDYPAFWPTSPSTPIMWDAGYSQYTVTITCQDEFLPRWFQIILMVMSMLPLLMMMMKC